MVRDQLINVYLDWINNFLTIGGFADYYGLTDMQAETLINLARDVYNSQHPAA